MASIDIFLSEQGKTITYPSKGIIQQAAEAKGCAINATLGVALTDDGNPLVLDSLAKQTHLSAKETFLYASTFGQENLRKKRKDLIKSKNPSLKNEISLPLVVTGLTHGCWIAGSLLADAETPIIVPDYFRGNYKLIFKTSCQGKLTTFPFLKENEINLSAFAETLAAQTQKTIVLLNFPNNPTGYSPTTEEVDALCIILQKKAEEIPIVVICDDAYFGLFYEEDTYKESIFGRLAGLHPNILAVKIDGVSKEYYAWGLRIGFLTFGGVCTEQDYDTLVNKAAAFCRGNISNACQLSQSMISAMLTEGKYEQECENSYYILKERYEAVKNIVTNPRYKECFSPLPFNSGYFMAIKLHKGDAEDIRKKLIAMHSIGVISLPDVNVIRIAFSSVAKEHVKVIFDTIYTLLSSQ